MSRWARTAKAAVPQLLPSLALVLALGLIRVEIAADLRMSTAEALGSGLWRGWYFDLVAVVLVGVCTLALWIVSAPPRLVWSALAVFAWTACLANALYFKFFGMPLDWWIVAMHWEDTGMVRGSAAELGLTARLTLSFFLLAAGVSLAVLRPRLERRLGRLWRPAATPWRERGHRLGLAVAVWLLSAFLWTAPKWTSHPATYAVVLSDNILRQWLRQTYSSRMFVGVGMRWADELGKGLSPDEQRVPTRVLAELRQLPTRPAAQLASLGAPPPPAIAPAAPAHPDWPLVRQLAIDPEAVRHARARLGLPESGPIHIVLLFSESMRAYELLHDGLAPQIYPRLRRLLDDRSVWFTQAYSSSFSAGQTVRGQFSTQCSMLPNMLGPAEYIAHTTVRLACVQEFLKAHGYRTTWFNSHTASYHGKRAFESLHGMDEYYDREFFAGLGITQRIGDWGLADRPVLAATADKLAELAKDGRPLYANILTISTHHPYSVIPEGPLPEALARAAAGVPEYEGFLSRFRYADDALADFVERLFSGPIGERTLVVLLGDHGSPISPHLPLGEVQEVELRFRVPLALLTKNLPRPERLSHPVHQLDVVPTVAAIAGLPGEVTWLGRDLFADGSPWTYVSGDLVHYRVGARACYTVGKAVSCYDVGGADPLLEEPTTRLAERPEDTRFFRSVAHATMRAIALNLIAPARLPSAAQSGSMAPPSKE